MQKKNKKKNPGMFKVDGGHHCASFEDIALWHFDEFTKTCEELNVRN